MRETGPQSAEVHVGGNALVGIAYWRTALVGSLEGATLVSPRATALSATYQLDWR